MLRLRYRVGLAALLLVLAVVAVRRYREDGPGLYVAGADGSGMVRLTRGAVAPAWSPDGARLAFAEGMGIGVMDADGAGRSRVTENPDAGPPVWSPDGAMIAFVATEEDALYVIRPDGAVLTKLPGASLPTGSAGDRGFAGQPPAWSPDGTTLAVVSWGFRGVGDTIHAVQADGSGLTTLVQDAGDVCGPAWSPSGDKLAFAAEAGLFVANADGSRATNLTPGLAFDLGGGEGCGPDWSPDGAKLLFASDRGVQVIASDGSGLSTLGVDGSEPAWSPDGAKIAFAAASDGGWDVYVMNADGSGTLRIAGTQLDDRSPVWSPDGTKIAFYSSPPYD